MLFHEKQTSLLFFKNLNLNFNLADWSLTHDYALYIRKVVNLAIETEMSVQTIPHSSINYEYSRKRIVKIKKINLY